MEIFCFISVILIFFLIGFTNWCIIEIKDINIKLDRIGEVLIIRDLNHKDEWTSYVVSNIKKYQESNNKEITAVNKRQLETKEELDKLKFELKNPPEYYEGQKLKDGRICTKVEVKVSLIKWYTLDWNKDPCNNVQPIERINCYFWNYEFATPKTKPKK